MFNEMIENPALLTDGYKFCHKDQYPAGLEWTYETWTPRKSRIEGVTHAVFFGLYYCQYKNGSSANNVIKTLSKFIGIVI